MDSIDPAKSASSPLVKFDSCEPVKALRVSWDMTSDYFRFLAPNGIISCHDPMTKRSVLNLASKMFDPMGLISPLTSCGGRDYGGITHWTVTPKRSGHHGNQIFDCS